VNGIIARPNTANVDRTSLMSDSLASIRNAIPRKGFRAAEHLRVTGDLSLDAE
jgi:hypothetical protein